MSILEERLKQLQQENGGEGVPQRVGSVRPDVDNPGDDLVFTQRDYDELQEMETVMEDDELEKEKQEEKKKHRILAAIMTAVCVYLTILIFGAVETDFAYDESGRLVPMIYTSKDISSKNEFLSVVGFYIECRNLYERVLTLDYRMASGVEDTMLIAPEYETVITDIDILGEQIEASVTDTRYTQIMSMIYSWVNIHLFNYCRYMSIAVTQNDSSAASEAIAARQVLMDNFQLITKNMIVVGGEIKGYSLEDLEGWSPEGYVLSEIEGIKE